MLLSFSFLSYAALDCVLLEWRIAVAAALSTSLSAPHSPLFRCVMKALRSSLGASGTPLAEWRLKQALTTKVHELGASGLEASVPA